MPRKLRDRAEGAFHHVFVRGNRKAEVFRDDDDRRWFLGRLLEVEEETRSLHMAHCLMTNHIHLLFRPGTLGLSRILQRVMGMYAQWFNHRHGHVGHVFQGRFGSRAIESDEDLLWILRYVHRNPVEAGMVPRPELWKWSSHADHLRPVPPRYVREGVAIARSLLSADPNRALVLYRRLVGRADGDYLLPAPGEGREAAALPDPGPDWSTVRPSLEDIARGVEARTSVGLEALRGSGRTPAERAARRYFCRSARREWGFSLHETATFLGRSLSQVSDLAREEGGSGGKGALEVGQRNAEGGDLDRKRGALWRVGLPPEEEGLDSEMGESEGV